MNLILNYVISQEVIIILTWIQHFRIRRSLIRRIFKESINDAYRGLTVHPNHTNHQSCICSADAVYDV
jgi:hypothetical protein